MLHGFWKLTWVETKVFIREPMGVVGSLGIPVVIFIMLGRSLGSGRLDVRSADRAPFNVSILAALIIAVGAVLSLVTIISIYREGGILKRLRRATPLSPVTILGAHVFVKLVFTVVSRAGPRRGAQRSRLRRAHVRPRLGLLVLAGRQFLPGAMDVHLPSFTAALLLSTLSILSIGFVIASIVPTARFAQPIGAALLYAR